MPGIYPSGRLCWLAHVTRSISWRSSIGQDVECSPTNFIIIVPHPSFPSHPLPATTTRVLSTIRRIRDLLPDTVVVLQAVLPRGVDGPDPFRLPNLFTWPLYVVNEHLRWARGEFGPCCWQPPPRQFLPSLRCYHSSAAPALPKGAHTTSPPSPTPTLHLFDTATLPARMTMCNSWTARTMC